jgi:hypothetical protein
MFIVFDVVGSVPRYTLVGYRFFCVTFCFSAPAADLGLLVT